MNRKTIRSTVLRCVRYVSNAPEGPIIIEAFDKGTATGIHRYSVTDRALCAVSMLRHMLKRVR